MNRIVVDVLTGEQRTIPLSPEEIAALQKHQQPKPTKAEQRSRRLAAFRDEADPLLFKAQRDEATMEEWRAKVEEIRARYPYPQANGR